MRGNLIHGDALELLPSVKDADLLLTDAPYRLNKTTGGRAAVDVFASRWKGTIRNADTSATLRHNSIEWREWLPLAYEALADQAHAYVFCNDKNLQDALNASSEAGFRLHNVLTWRKSNATPNKWYMKRLEFLLFLFKGRAFPISNKGSSQDLCYPVVPSRQRLHPLEKPVPLLRVLIENSTRPDALVFDPFAGSCATGVAAVECGRRFLGFEVDEQHFLVGKKRLEQEP